MEDDSIFVFRNVKTEIIQQEFFSISMLLFFTIAFFTTCSPDVYYFTHEIYIHLLMARAY